MISEIGCTNDGGVWISLFAEIGGEQQKAIIPMDAKKAKEVYFKIGEAIAMGATWKKTGVKPNVANSTGIDKGKPPGDKRDSKR
jgi:hypothetical protein